MSREWIAAFGFILIFVLVAWRVPIDIAMGIAGVLGFGMVVGAQPALNLFGNVLLSVLTDDNLSVIPLLVIFVLCGIMTETDVSKLFFAGVVPRLPAVALYVGCVMFNYHRQPHLLPAGPLHGWPERLRSLRELWPTITLFLVVLDGI